MRKSQLPFTHPPKHLCIIRLSAIGDVCNAIAMVQQIQRHWPQTEITWIVGKTESAIVSLLPNVNTLVFDKRSGWLGVIKLWLHLRKVRFDALLNIQSSLRASLLSLGIRAGYKLGYAKDRAREKQHWFTNIQVESPQSLHVLDNFLAFSKTLGVPLTPPSWQIPIPEDAQQAIKPFIDPQRKNVLIAPCASKAERDWTLEGYIELARYLQNNNINVLLGGGNSQREQEIASMIANSVSLPIVNCVGKTTLVQYLALLGQVDLVISPDSGPAHMATTQNTPVIGLYAAQNPARTGPYYSLDKVISVYQQNVEKQYQQPLNELPWGTRAKGELMAQIQIDDVIAMVKQQLAL